MKIIWGFIAFVFLIGVGLQLVPIFRDRYDSSTASVPFQKSFEVTLEAGLDRKDIANRIGSVMGYDEKTIEQFHATYRAMQWDAYNDVVIPTILERKKLREKDVEILYTHSTTYLDAEEDILETLYIPGVYTVDATDTVVSIATKLIEPILLEKNTLIPPLLDENQVTNLVDYTLKIRELLPDLVPLPPQDIVLRNEGGRLLLTFTTIYYNRGKGNLELRADPKTMGVQSDLEREVFQRVYRDDGSYRERTAGTFNWHQEHLHYHFSDFIEYKLEPIENNFAEIDVLAQKSTFCIRDVSRVEVQDVPNTLEADYRICGKERQGVTRGWGDAYFNTYVDQNLDITELPSGTYRLSFLANPADRFDEETKDNNVSSAVIIYTKESGKIELTGTEPNEIPFFEHIHVEQNL